MPLAMASTRVAAPGQGPRVAERYALIEEALSYPAGSVARGKAVADAAARSGKDKRTIQRDIAIYQTDGMNGLARKKPANAGERRVMVSRTFDEAVRGLGWSEEQLADAAKSVDQDLIGSWKTPAEQMGWSEIGEDVSFELRKRCKAIGVQLPKAAYRLSRARVDRFKHYRVVNVMNNDRKRFADNEPTIDRDWTCYAPMEIVVGDVKAIDVPVMLPDGLEVWPRMVAFLDAGTGRIFHRIFWDRERFAIRREHVIDTFLQMVADPSWGFPKTIYLDNGKEFGGLERIRHALNLLHDDPNARSIVYARPYRGQSKPIESRFARLDRYVFSQMPGHAGGDRMRRKTQNVGIKPAPFQGGTDLYVAIVEDLIKLYQAKPTGGLWKGLSAFQWFERKIAEGWRPVTVDPLSIDTAFCEAGEAQLRQGKIRFKGLKYSHPSLAGLPMLSKVDLAIPWRRGAPPLFKHPDHGWAYLEELHPYPAMDLEGAKASGRMKRDHLKTVQAMGRDGSTIDPVGIRRERAAEITAPVVPVTGASDRLSLGTQLTDLGKARATADAALLTAQSDADRRAKAMENRTKRLLRNMTNAA